MDPIVKKLWTDALRSGRYRQGQKTLRRIVAKSFLGNPSDPKQDEYCCLGVLCDLYAQEHPDQPGWDSGRANIANSIPFYYEGKQGPDLGRYEHDYLPPTVMEWAGLSQNNPSITIGCKSASISHFNDGCGFSFDKLADAIDEQH